MAIVRKLAVYACAVGGLALSANALAATFGPSSYVQASNSPFAAVDFTGGYFYLEDFEDGSLNTPGASVIGGFVNAPATTTDSVDHDDGLIDGSGQLGRSYYSDDTTLEFNFSAVDLLNLPTHAGIVWTDVGNNSGDIYAVSEVVIEAYDQDNMLIDSIAVTLGDGRIDGTTAEDRFFGFSNEAGGILAIVITMPASSDWEVDHLQYGYVPEPASAVLAAAGLLILRRRR